MNISFSSGDKLGSGSGDFSSMENSNEFSGSGIFSQPHTDLATRKPMQSIELSGSGDFSGNESETGSGSQPLTLHVSDFSTLTENG